MKIGSFVMNCNDFESTISFWRDTLGYVERKRSPKGDFAILQDPNGRSPNVSIQALDNLKFGRNRMHLDLYAEDQHAEVERLLKLGATIHDAPGGHHDFVIMADPEGKLFCVVGENPERYWRPKT